ncbi:MAG TPA: S8 family serine peptidase, partial [Terriglobia bacterium]|nr:S8 family serine peptidase [Terriglobia bacterium]
MKKVLFVILVVSIGAFADDSKISTDLKGHGGESLDVIVQYKTPPGQSHPNHIQRDHGRVKRDLPLIDGFSASIPASSLSDLSNDPDVKFISPDRPVSGALVYSTEAASASYAWNFGFDGSKIGVAVIDSGISSAPDFNKRNAQATRIAYSENFVAGSSTTEDLYGHGTHVASIIAANGAASTCASCFRTFKGMAPDANLISLRALDEHGAGRDSFVIAAINRAIELKSQYNIRVINLSLSRPVYDSYLFDPLCRAVERAWNAGIVVVVAAGNDG